MNAFFEQHDAKIEYGAPTGCWLWNAALAGGGYGTARLNGPMRYAHRLAYEAVHGEGSATGLVVRHRCDTPSCVNPDHLETGTKADNSQDMVKRGRSTRGEKNYSAKLSEDEVRMILDTYVPYSQEFGQYAIARRFGVSRSLVGNIVTRKGWGHVSQ